MLLQDFIDMSIRDVRAGAAEAGGTVDKMSLSVKIIAQSHGSRNILVPTTHDVEYKTSAEPLSTLTLEIGL
jgi:hypothetical protein